MTQADGTHVSLAGQNQKSICTDAAIHSICVTFGTLATYKLHCRAYSGKHDKELNYVRENVANTQKWVNLYGKMIHKFKGMG